MLRHWLVLCAICGCEQRETTATPPPSIAPLDPTVRIEDVPKFAEYRDRKTPYDCTIISALQARFAGTRVETCGALGVDATPEAKAASIKCATRALEAARPVLFAQAWHGTDSAIAGAGLARFEHGTYVAYSAIFDSDPCGGSCSERGWTRIVRCQSAPRLSADCPADGLGTGCLECEGPPVESCRNGRPSSVPRADAEHARDALIGSSPASLVLGPLHLGAPVADWTSPSVRATIEKIEAGGIVSVVQDRPPHGAHIDAIELHFDGPCTKVRDVVVTRWGSSADDIWIDPAAHQRAHFDIEPCRLRIERYLDVDAWIADNATAPMPLAAIGQRASAFAKAIGAELTNNSVRWVIPGIGRATGVVRLHAIVERGRITSFDARGTTDAATIAQLRARITALRGAPIRDEGGRQIWRGVPPIHLDDGPEFSISVSNWTDDPH
jgi:hypothetical protein